MAYSYPIWHNVEACIYNSSKSYGAKDCAQTEILVGSSASNSEQLAMHHTTRSTYDDCVVFRFKVEGDTIRFAVFTLTKRGTAGELITKGNRRKYLAWMRKRVQA